MILLVDLCYRENSLGYDEYVRPVERVVTRNGFAASSVHFHSLTGEEIQDADAVILCGTPLADLAFLGDSEHFAWMKATRIPVLGICAGMELAACILGGVLESCREIGMTRVNAAGNHDPIFSEPTSFPAYELHSLALLDPGPFRVLARSDRCVQAIRHHTLPVYGVMFHPEVRNEWVIDRFLSWAGNKDR